MTRGLWDRETVAVFLIAAVMPVAVVWLWYGGADAISALFLTLVVVAGWQFLFMLARAQPPSLAGALTALAVAILAPEEIGAVRLAVGLSFGAVMGELVFGGWGRNVVHPATVALAFLGFGFPSFPWPDLLLPVAWAAIPAALIGVGAGAMPGPVIAGAALVGSAAAGAGLIPAGTLPAAGLVLVLLVADPVTSAATTLGRWLNGALYAALVAVFASGWAGAAAVQIAVAAALLASLAAPALDEIAIALWLHRRRRRHGRP